MLTKNLISQLNLNIKKISPVHGGDINEAYHIEVQEGDFFIKLNSTSNYPALFEKEANGLKALSATNTLKTPEVIATGNFENTQYLLLEWIAPDSPNVKAWKTFGQQLATMHQIPQNHFGFAEDNYLGTYLQENTSYNTWAEFYGNCRVLPMIRLLYSQGKIGEDVVNAANNFSKELNSIFPTEPPSLLHGDLWSGNFIISQYNNTALIDPAVYCGHREMDLGMSRLFGGFAPQFYEAYNEVYPLEKNWEQRLPYTQLYPLLFHAYAFGGHYIQSIKNILKPFN